jgi:hypothetical protein
MKYGIIFWDNSSDRKKVFTLKKKTVIIRVGAKSRNSGRGLFKRFEILTLPCEYIFSLTNIITNNQEHVLTNSSVHRVNTGNKHHLHRPIADVFNTGIKIFNDLPSSLESLMNEKVQFKVALKRYLHTHPFCSEDELLLSKNDSSF